MKLIRGLTPLRSMSTNETKQPPRWAMEAATRIMDEHSPDGSASVRQICDTATIIAGAAAGEAERRDKAIVELREVIIEIAQSTKHSTIVHADEKRGIWNALVKAETVLAKHPAP